MSGSDTWAAVGAEGIDAWARQRGGMGDELAGSLLIALGRSIALYGLDGQGKPSYWMAFGAPFEIDDFDEHWGEAAYLVALAAFWDHKLNMGSTDQALPLGRDALISETRQYGEVGQLRSFNWQCRAAPMTSRLVALTDN